ncbi:MAG: hypothetical protein HYV60_03220 [Planctomycetia bacterium]|nr:hypothetical protein [Planctomycetia bacterium]
MADSSGALAGRMQILRLTESFFGREDHTLSESLLNELPGILLWAIEGWRRLRERGYFSQPESGCDLFDELSELSSPVGAFVRERCHVGTPYCVPVAEIFADWLRWCERNGRDSHGTQQTFGRDLLAAVPSIRKSQPRDGETRYRAYEGIDLID